MGSHFQERHNYYLDIEGHPAGRPNVVSAAEDVEFVVMQTNYLVKKIPTLRRSHIDLSLGSNMGKPMHQWLEDTLNQSFNRKNGSVMLEDPTKKTARMIEFLDAVIESIELPSLDKASKDGQYLKVKLLPDNLKFGNTGEKFDQKKAIKYGTPPQPFDRSHFKVTITGLATECAAVYKIDSIVIKQGIAAANDGSQRTTVTVPTKLDESNLVITLPMSSGKGFLDWHQKSVEAGATDTRSGSLEYFAKGSKSSQFTLNFDGLGLLSAEGSKGSSGDANRELKCSLYYKSAILKPN